MKKKILSVFLTVAMILSMATMFVGTVSATEADLTISTYAELETFIASLAEKDYAGETVVLGADITVNEGWVANDGTSAAVAAPTGDNAKTLDTAVATNAFAGTFDGQNHTISGLYMTGTAFLPKINGATIQNVTFDNCSSIPSKNAGIVAALHSNGNITFTNVVVKNSKIVNGTSDVYMGTMLGNTSSKSSTFTFESCQSIDCNLYNGAKTNNIGGLVGVVGTNTSATFNNCFNSTDIYSMPASASYYNAGYKCGGIVGVVGCNTATITNCVNEGNVTSFTIAGGFVGDTSKAVSVKNCINRGTITADVSGESTTTDAYAGGIFGRINNNGACSVISCINFGNIVATNDNTAKLACAGGLIGDGCTKPLASGVIKVENCLNQGELSADQYAGGVYGRTGGDLDISNFVNTGDITGKKAGGVIGFYGAAYWNAAAGNGTIKNVITIGTLTGANSGGAGAIVGDWTEKEASGELEIIDVFYSNNGNDNAICLWAELGTKYANYKASYTATEKSLDFVPGTTNLEENVPDDYVDGNAANTCGENLAIYNDFFVKNGYQVDATNFYAEKGANTFKAFNLGVDWMMTDTVPVPASVFALMDEKDIVEGEVDYVGYQANAGTTLSSIRVATGLNNIENYENTGFELYLIEAGEEALWADMNTTTVYTSLNVYDADGNAQDPFLASDAGYAYLSAITVTCTAEQLGDTTTLIVKPYVTVNGAKIYGSACAILIEKNDGVLTIADQYVL